MGCSKDLTKQQHKTQILLRWGDKTTEREIKHTTLFSVYTSPQLVYVFVSVNHITNLTLC